MDRHTKAYFYAILSTLLLPVGYIANTIVLRTANPLTAAMYMFTLTPIIAVLVTYVTGRKKKLVKAKKHWKGLALLGLLTSISATTWFIGLSLVGPSTLGFLIRFVIVFTVILGVIFLKETFNKLEALGITAMIAGALIISYKGTGFAAGAVLAIISALAFSIFSLKVKGYVKRMDPMVINTGRLFFASPFVILFGLASGAFAPMPIESVLLISIAAISVVAGFTLMFKAYENADLSKVAAIGSIEPLIILVYSFAVFATLPSGLELAGGAIILAGTFLLIRFRKKPKVPAIEE